MRSIKLMADYHSHPLWEASPGQVGNIDPATLPISSELVAQLAKWARMYDATLNPADPVSSGFKSEQEQAEFKRLGCEIGERLKDELGPEYVLKMKI
jgi:hypothetical protein